MFTVLLQGRITLTDFVKLIVSKLVPIVRGGVVETVSNEFAILILSTLYFFFHSFFFVLIRESSVVSMTVGFTPRPLFIHVLITFPSFLLYNGHVGTLRNEKLQGSWRLMGLVNVPLCTGGEKFAL